MHTLSFSQKFSGMAAVTIFAAVAAIANPAVAQYQQSLDYGPFTPEASSAYMGGGVIIEQPAQPAPRYTYPQYSYTGVAQPYYPSPPVAPPAAYMQPYPAGYYAPPVVYARPYYPAPFYPYGPGYFCRWPGYC